MLDGPYLATDPLVNVTNPVGAVPKKGTEKVRVVVDSSESGINGCMPARPVTLPNGRDALERVRARGWFGAKC